MESWRIQARRRKLARAQKLLWFRSGGMECLRRTSLPLRRRNRTHCGIRLRQTMHHHAQSDYDDFFVSYQDNELGEEIGGRVLQEPNPNKTSIGFITSSKNITQTLPNAVTNLTYCPFLSLLKDRLPKCFDSTKKP